MIKDMLESERPRERLLNDGVESLSNEELLSIIIKTGTKNISVKELSRNILKELNNIDEKSVQLFSKLEKALSKDEVEDIIKAANGKEMSDFIRELVLRQVKQDIENNPGNQSPR